MQHDARRPPDESALDRATLVRDVRARLFAPLAAGGPGAPRIGAEVEMIPVDARTRHPSPLEAGARSVLSIVRAAGARRGWIETRSAKAGVPQVCLPDGGRITFEPGGQIEVSSAPSTSASAVLEGVDAVIAPLATEAERRGVELLFVGIDPLTPVQAVEPQLDAPRYRRMRRYFAGIGPSGARMMRQTASFQVAVDTGDDPAASWRLLNALAPYLVAIFANSPRYEGRPTGHQSFRRVVWGTLDPLRTGIAWRGGDAADDYVEFALGAPAFLLGEEGEAPRPFGELIAVEDSPEARPTFDDWRTHLSTLFPEVRPRGYLEVRSADAVAPRWHAAPLALLGGLAYAPAARREAEALVGDPDPSLLARAGRDGLRDERLASVARDLCRLAVDGCRALGEGFMRGRDLELATEFFERYTLRGLSPADDEAGAGNDGISDGASTARLGAAARQ